MTKPILIDCDPGQDDAVMLLMALAVPDRLDVKGIVTVAGNVDVRKTERNARIIRQIADRSDIPVFAGYDRPMVRELEVADHVHGLEGMDGIDIFEPTQPCETQHGVDFIIDTCRAAAPGELTLIPTGPLTNIAHAFQKAPEIPARLKEIVLMGGAYRMGGNVTPSAEYNIYADPHAADIVYQAGCPIVTIGLDVTHKLITTPELEDKLAALGTDQATAAVSILKNYAFFDKQKYGSTGAPLHDPATIAYVLAPELFETKHVNLRVEINSALTLGHTAVDFWNDTGLEPNTHWAHGVDTDAVFDLVVDVMGQYS